jgi:hypothetical protein
MVERLNPHPSHEPKTRRVGAPAAVILSVSKFFVVRSAASAATEPARSG